MLAFSRSGLLIAALLLVLSSVAAFFRSHHSLITIGDLPQGEIAGELAFRYASAMRIACCGALWASVLVMAASSTSRASEGVHPSGLGRETASTAPQRALRVAALLWGLAALSVPQAALAAAVALGLSVLIVSRPSSSVLGLAALLAASAACAGAQSELYRAAALFRVDDLDKIDPVMLGLLVTCAGGLFAGIAALQLLRESRAGALAAVIVLLPVLTLTVYGHQVLAHGPPALTLVDLPVHRPSLASRPVRGCLVEGDEVTAIGGAVCPGEPIFFAGGPRSESHALMAIVERGGEVGVLARMDEGWSLVRWRTTAVPVTVRVGIPDNPALLLLPDPVIAAREGDLWRANGMPLTDAIRARVARSVRADVVVPLAAVPTIDELLSVCGLVQATAPGVRCVLADAPADSLVAPTLPPQEPFEIIETGDETE